VKGTRRRRGRPPREHAALLEDHILDVASELFLAAGYGQTSIDLLARRAGTSKRTIYDRFPDKAAVFKAVIHRIVNRLRPTDVAGLFVPGKLEDVLLRICLAVLHAALQPEALALHRVIVAEAGRFPELAAMVADRPGSQEAIQRIAALLQTSSPRAASAPQTAFAATQFLYMTIAAPQRRAMVLGTPMAQAELETWARQTVALFIKGWRGSARPSKARKIRSPAR
jgi:TetR/AcrR family transcriptional repressor of mexJK operon